jgi:hypothetical protein
VGGNSGCRVHARSHFQAYKQQCDAAGIKVHHHAMPRKLFNAMKEDEAKGKEGSKQQSTLDNIVVKEKVEFSRENILHEVSKFVACGNQVSRTQL